MPAAEDKRIESGIELPGLTSPAVRNLAAELKVSLTRARPPIWRRIQVKGCTLDKLHEHIQASMGWTNSHLYEIRAGGVGWGMTDPDWGDGPLDARKARLVDALGRCTARAAQSYRHGRGV